MIINGVKYPDRRPCSECNGTGKIAVYDGPRTPLGRQAMAIIEPDEIVPHHIETCRKCGGLGNLPMELV